MPCVSADLWWKKAFWPCSQQWLCRSHQSPWPGAAKPLACGHADWGPGASLHACAGHGLGAWSRWWGASLSPLHRFKQVLTSLPRKRLSCFPPWLSWLFPLVSFWSMWVSVVKIWGNLIGCCYMGLRLMVEMYIRSCLKPTSWSFCGDGSNAANLWESPPLRFWLVWGCFSGTWK